LKASIAIFLSFFFTFSSIAQTTYQDVAPIFYSRCTSCHNQYSHGAALLNYSQVKANVSTIQAYLNSGYMPPWHPDTNYTRFTNEHTITQVEKTSILNWIASGAPKGDTTLAPPIPVYNRYQLNGTPSLELKMPTYISKASTTDSHVNFALPTGLTQDRVIRAFEVVAGNPAIVHHVIISIDTTGAQTTDTSGACFPSASNIILGGYAPGGNPCVYPGQMPLKIGTQIKAGSNIMLNMHYPAGTVGQTDSTKIRIYFYPIGTTGIRPVKRFGISTNSLTIPANKIITYTAQYPASGNIPFEMSVFSIFPHSHHLCKSILNYAGSTTDTIPLIRISNWDFDFQGYYTFRKLVHITASHKIYAKHVYDNTSQNLDNPNSPPANVYFGQNSANEMLSDNYEYIQYQEKDELINVDSLLSADSLLVTLVKQNMFFAKNVDNYAYPNPFEHTINIAYTLDKASKISINMYNTSGVCVKTLYTDYESEGAHEKVWDGKDNEGQKLYGGSYFYIIRVDGKPCIGKVTLLP